MHTSFSLARLSAVFIILLGIGTGGCGSVGGAGGKSAVVLLYNEPLCFTRPPRGGYWLILPDRTWHDIYYDQGNWREWAKGRWTYDKAGVLSLFSDDRVGDVIAGSLHVIMGSRKGIGALTVLRQEVARLLQDSDRMKWSLDPAGARPALQTDSGLWVQVDMEPDNLVQRPHVTRSELLALANAIDRYLKDPACQAVRFQVHNYKGSTFLVPLNTALPRQRDLSLIRRLIDDGSADAGGVVPVLVPSTQFAKDTGYEPEQVHLFVSPVFGPPQP